jgi:hypothetical protein
MVRIRILQKEFANAYIAQQFVDLERFSVFSKILENGTNTQPFKGVTLQPVDNSIGKAVAHVGNSRQKFAARRGKVEARLNQNVGFRHDSTKATKS